MTPERAAASGSQESEEGRPEPEPTTHGQPSDAGAKGDDGTVPAKQIHRWKGEGGSLHPDD